MFLESRNIPASESVKVFLEGLFDYAGLFPPAILSMPDALREYRALRREGDHWMSGPFVCPVSRLEELLADIPGGRSKSDTMIPLSLLPRPVSHYSSFESSFLNDLQEIERLRTTHPGFFCVQMMEIKVPEGAAHHADTLDRMLKYLCDTAAGSEDEPIRIFLEISRGTRYSAALASAVEAISSTPCDLNKLSLKVRCGGIHPEDYPSCEELAQFIFAVIRASQSFKATAGLHHPVRHFNDNAATVMHGFLNVFFAAIFCAVLGLEIDDLASVLAEEDPARFQFVDTGIQFNNYFASTEQIRTIRSAHAMSIGSCSFDEPRADLVALHWLTSEQAQRYQ